jgi:hypothetical protein
LLHEAVNIAGQHDPYVAAYLVAECAPYLLRCGDGLLELIERITPEVEALGFAGVAERLASLRVRLGAASPSINPPGLAATAAGLTSAA